MQINMNSITSNNISDPTLYWFKNVLTNIIINLEEDGYSIELFSYKEKDRYVIEAYKGSLKLKISYIAYDYLGDVNKWFVAFLKKGEGYDFIIPPKYFNKQDYSLLKDYISKNSQAYLIGKK